MSPWARRRALPTRVPGTLLLAIVFSWPASAGLTVTATAAAAGQVGQGAPGSSGGEQAAGDSSSSRIAFVGYGADSTSRIYVMDADGTNARAVTAGPQDNSPSWSPDGQTIAFSRRLGDGHVELFTIKADDASGQSLNQLTNGAYDYGPTWSPDGSRIAFLRAFPNQPPPDPSDQANQLSIFLVNPDGSGIAGTGARSWAAGARLAWSPDGGRIAFSRWVVDVRRLAILNLEGSGQTTLSTDFCRPWGATAADWSPDGTKLVFYCDIHGNPNAQAWIATVSPSGGAFVTIGDALQLGGWPTWSPDGSKIAISGGPSRTIKVIGADGSGSTDLGSGGAAYVGQLDWSSAQCSGLIGRVSDGHADHLSSIRVQLYDGLIPVGRFVKTDKDGKYCIAASSGTITGDTFRVRATLADGDHDPALFETWEDGFDGAVFADVKVLAGDVGRSNIDIDFTDSADRPHLRDVSVIHYESNRFIHWLLDTVGVPAAAFVPVTIVTFGPEKSAGGGTRYTVSDHKAWLAASYSRYANRASGTDECPENCEWHELAHHLARVWHIAPTDETPVCQNRVAAHAGWLNPSSCSSLQEGFAMWLPALASLDLDAGRGANYGTPDYSVFGSLDDNGHRPWDLVTIDGELMGHEDLAVSQLLWDLADATPDESMWLEYWDATQSSCRYFFDGRDTIAIGGIALLQLLGHEKPQTVADLYNSLQASSAVPFTGRTTSIDMTADGKPDVSALAAEFIGHGFNPVPDAANPCYRLDAPVSRTDHVPDANGGLVERRNEPKVPGSAIRFTNPGTSDATFTLDVTYPSTSSHFEIVVPAQSSRLVHFEVPPYWPAALAADAPLPDCGGQDQREKVTLKLSGPGVPDQTLDSCAYLHDVATAIDGAALSFGGALAAVPTPPTSGDASPPIGLAIMAVGLGAVVVAAVAAGVIVRRRRRIW